MLRSLRTPSIGLVSVLAACALALGLVTAVSTSADASGGDYRQVVDITFPVLGPNSYIDDYDQARGGGTRHHKATDIMADYGQQVHAAVGGQITWIPGAENDTPPSYGYMITIRGDDGRYYSYVHLGSQNGPASEAYVEGLRQGDRVERGEHIGYVGHSGNAHPDHPHLHFEIRDDAVSDPYGSTYINPYYSLEDAEARGDLPGAEPQAPPLPRIEGSSRIGTALALSEWAFDSAETVVVASSKGFADGLAAGPLAGALDAPLLLTPPDRLPTEVADHIGALGADRAIVVGGEGALDPRIEDDLVEAGIPRGQVRRIGGQGRYETAALVAETVLDETGTDAVMLAVGHHPEERQAFPDALSASAYGATFGVPVLLVTRDDLQDATRRLLAARDWGGGVHVVGGEAAISEEVREAAADAARTSVGRVDGADRYETATAIADLANGRNGGPPSAVLLATGMNWPDALAAGPAVAERHVGFLLVHPTELSRSEATQDWIERHDLDEAWIIGGTGAVSDSVAREVAALLR